MSRCIKSLKKKNRNKSFFYKKRRTSVKKSRSLRQKKRRKSVKKSRSLFVGKKIRSTEIDGMEKGSDDSIKSSSPEKGSDDSIKLTIYSFNVLNPDIETAYMTFKSVFKGDPKMVDSEASEAKKLAHIDLKRFDERMNMILEIIDEWLVNSNAVVHLQEVCGKFLEVLKAKYGTSLAATSVQDYVFFGNPRNRKQAFKDEHRVTIVGKSIKIITASDIEITNNDARKNCLHTILSVNDQLIHSFNIHFHWRSEKEHYISYGKIMKSIACCKPFYICGDFNKSINHDAMIAIKKVMGCSALPSSDSYTGSTTSSKDDDIVLYPEMPEYKVAFIDNILFGNCDPVDSELSALYKVRDMEIFYNINEIRTSILGEKEFVFPERRFVSDHVPVSLTLQFKNK